MQDKTQQLWLDLVILDSVEIEDLVKVIRGVKNVNGKIVVVKDAVNVNFSAAELRSMHKTNPVRPFKIKFEFGEELDVALVPHDKKDADSFANFIEDAGGYSIDPLDITLTDADLERAITERVLKIYLLVVQHNGVAVVISRQSDAQ